MRLLKRPSAARRCGMSAECACADLAATVSPIVVFRHSHGTAHDRMSLSIRQSSVWAHTLSLSLSSHCRPSASHVIRGFPRRMLAFSYKPFGTKVRSFTECRKKKKKNEMWRGVGLAERFLFCYSGFVTSLANAYLSLVERISVTDRVVQWNHLLSYHSHTYIADTNFFCFRCCVGRLFYDLLQGLCSCAKVNSVTSHKTVTPTCIVCRTLPLVWDVFDTTFRKLPLLLSCDESNVITLLS
jgi:hypothetical protein